MTTRFVLALGFLTLALSSSCTNTVETKVEVHDTVYSKGPAFIRFMSAVPGVSSIILRRDSSQSGAPLISALPSVSRLYLPVKDSTAITLYADYVVDGKPHLDEVTVYGALAASSLTTFALFLSDDNQGHATTIMVLMPDTAKRNPPPEGYAYLRFVNGMADAPNPTPQLYLNLDNATNSVFKTGSQPKPVPFGEPENYTLVPAGTHELITTSESGEQMEITNQNFVSGGYYTARVLGRRSDGSDRLIVDDEN